MKAILVFLLMVYAPNIVAEEEKEDKVEEASSDDKENEKSSVKLQEQPKNTMIKKNVLK